MMLRREIMCKKKPKRQKETIVFEYLLFQQEFYQYMKKYQKALLTSNLQLAETAQATDSNHKQSGMQSLY